MYVTIQPCTGTSHSTEHLSNKIVCRQFTQNSTTENAVYEGQRKKLFSETFDCFCWFLLNRTHFLCHCWYYLLFFVVFLPTNFFLLFVFVWLILYLLEIHCFHCTWYISPFFLSFNIEFIFWALKYKNLRETFFKKFKYQYNAIRFSEWKKNYFIDKL